MEKRIIMKFGGAAIAEVSQIQRVAEIVSNFLEKEPNRQLVVVASAMGKTTNKLESVMHLKLSAKWEDLAGIAFERLLNEHLDTAHALRVSSGLTFSHNYTYLKNTLESVTEINPQSNDLVLSCGELISTAILHEYLLALGINSLWLDARDYVRTDSKFGSANVDWEKTKENFNGLNSKAAVVILQGFIGADYAGNTTTLGRDGSDYTAAIAAVSLANVKKVILWKDVEGIYAKDPKQYPDAEFLRYLSPKDAMELIATSNVVHRNTIETLQKEDIPLQIRSFKEELFENNGTLIS